MELQKNKSNFLKRIIVRAAKFPFLYFMLGVALLIFSYMDDILPLERFKNSFDLSDQLGTITVLFALVMFGYNFLVLICFRYELKFTENHIVAAMVISSIRKCLRIVFFLIALHIIIAFIGNRSYVYFAQSIINTVLIGSVGWVALQILYTSEALLYQKMVRMNTDPHSRAKALYTKIHIIKNIATVLIVVLTIAAILMTFNSVRNLGISLLASAGLLTAVVGLAAQKPLASIFSGLQLALAQPIKLGDYVVFDNIPGTVEEITFFYATIKRGDKRRLVVPINYFLEKYYENWSRVSGPLISSVELKIDYAIPLVDLRTELDKILATSNYWDGATGKIQVLDLGERAVEISIIISASNPDDLGNLKAEVREKMLNFLQQKYSTYFPIVTIKDGRGNEIANYNDEI